jgi:hypothetical protein
VIDAERGLAFEGHRVMSHRIEEAHAGVFRGATVGKQRDFNIVLPKKQAQMKPGSTGADDSNFLVHQPLPYVLLFCARRNES